MNNRAIPVIAVVGRPNVGKSTLFNYLTRTRKALVADVPGLTRDRKEEDVYFEQYHFRLIDTGGMPFADGAPLSESVTAQIYAAVEAADYVLLIVDGNEGLNPYDVELFRDLSRRKAPVMVLVNKIDHPSRESNMSPFYALGTDDIMPVSAIHGRGVSDVIAAIDTVVPVRDLDDLNPDETKPIRVAFLGRPNVGKSSLVNRILDDHRMIVSDIPGTTREAVDIACTFDNKKYLLIDTAGVRRRSRTKEYIEKIGVLSSLEAVRRADVAIMVIDAAGEIAEQDARLAGYIQDARRGAVIALNKWDLLQGKSSKEKEVAELAGERLRFLDFAPTVRTSALTGEGISRLFREIGGVYREYTRRIQTADLNRVIEMSIVRHAPPARGSRPTKIYYGLQTRERPPRFRFFTNHPEQINTSYERYMENQLRHHFGLKGTPLLLEFVARPKGRPRGSGKMNSTGKIAAGR